MSGLPGDGKNRLPHLRVPRSAWRTTERELPGPLAGAGRFMAKSNTRGWGIWLKDEREWATLPPRLCKPTPHNTDLTPAIIDVLRELDSQGKSPELKRIPSDTLAGMKKDYR